jgi:hypothetical protein
MPKQFYNVDGTLYRVDDKTGDVKRVVYEDINGTAEVKKVLAYLAALSADKPKEDID